MKYNNTLTVIAMHLRHGYKLSYKHSVWLVCSKFLGFIGYGNLFTSKWINYPGIKPYNKEYVYTQRKSLLTKVKSTIPIYPLFKSNEHDESGLSPWWPLVETLLQWRYVWETNVEIYLDRGCFYNVALN